MRTTIIKFKYVSLLFLFSFMFSCNEENFLKEVPNSFFSLENSYKTMNQLESALTGIYAQVRVMYYGGDNILYFMNITATDVAYYARGTSSNGYFGDYDVMLVPTSGKVKSYWSAWYKIISDANTILSRLEDSDLTDSQKTLVAAEAMFFRAFAYRNLVYNFGGVPLILNEITLPKTDFVRATKDDILTQMVKDLSDAANNLPPINKVTDGKVSNLVAWHYLAETYISLQKYDEAIAAASAVIDDQNTALMTSRFGSRANEKPYDKYLNFTQPGDVYWDLFQVGNQNRISGNKEALWVCQMEMNVDGGFLSASAYTNALERWAGPDDWATLKTPDGKEGMLAKPQSNYNSGGRGVSYMMNTNYFLNDLWKSDFDIDIRNAPHNIVRDVVYNNPKSAYYGKSAVLPDGTLNSPTWKSQNWRWYPYPSKITTPGQHPDELFEDKENLILKTGAGSTYKDMYILRLAETYLLRAEAYLGKGDKTNAAKDINEVRSRAKAKPVDAANVTIDYILDERARELIYEEQRRITLCRVGKLVERVRKYNDWNGDEIKDFHNLFPIPYSEIEANKDAIIEQNPGYN